MVDFVKKRLQIFVSSTYLDLRDERQAAVEAILSAGHIPAGMELFAAGDESQMEVIKQWIDESDVYLLILAGRYGTIDVKTGKSYTQLEYEYALNKSKPLFACVIKEAALDARIKQRGRDVIDKHAAELDAFRELVQTKMVKFWEDSKDIKIAIGETLSQFARRADLVGWVRPDQEANLPALADEIARLSKENARLRDDLSSRSEVTMLGLTFSQLKELLKRKGIWDFVVARRRELSETILETSEVDQLETIGLMRRRDMGYQVFVPTTEGRMFLNRLEIDSTV